MQKTSNISQSLRSEGISTVSVKQGVPIYSQNAEVNVWIHLMENMKTTNK